MKDVTRAAAAVIRDSEGRVLLVQQSSGRRRWGLPGAHIRPGDLPVDAIVREVRRETGMETRVVDLLGLYHLTGGLDGDDEELPDVLTYAFRCETIVGEPVLNGRGRICQLGWYSPRRRCPSRSPRPRTRRWTTAAPAWPAWSAT